MSEEDTMNLVNVAGESVSTETSEQQQEGDDENLIEALADFYAMIGVPETKGEMLAQMRLMSPEQLQAMAEMTAIEAQRLKEQQSPIAQPQMPMIYNPPKKRTTRRRI